MLQAPVQPILQACCAAVLQMVGAEAQLIISIVLACALSTCQRDASMLKFLSGRLRSKSVTSELISPHANGAATSAPRHNRKLVMLSGALLTTDEARPV